MDDAPYPGEVIDKWAEDSPRFKKTVNSVGPAIVGAGVSALSGNDQVGKAAKLAASAASAASPDGFAKAVAHAGFMAGTVVLTVAATPIFVVALPILVIASLFKKDK